MSGFAVCRALTISRAFHRRARPALVLLMAILLCNCASFNALTRKLHSESYVADLTAHTEQVLPADQPLGLDQCVQIALEHNLKGQAAEIQARIAQLERNIAFANFLPAVSMDASAMNWDNQPKSTMLAGMSIAMQDQTIRQDTVQFQMPIFLPATWYLYAIHERGTEIADWVLEYTRQMITLQVTALYFQNLSMLEAERAFESQVLAAQTLQQEVASFLREGMVASWQNTQVEALVLARQSALHQTQRARRQAEASLLTAMGVSPLASIPLAPSTPIEAPKESLEDLVAKALIHNPQLHIADRNIAIRHEQVKIAIAEFLPKLFGFANWGYNSNSMSVYSESLITGVSGVMTLFDGLANVNEYKVARQGEKAAYVQREEACLTVILQVVKAHLNVQTADEELALAEKLFDAASGHCDEVEAQWREGLVSPSDRLDVRAERDQAQMQVAVARYKQQVTVASLLNVLGAGYAGYEVQQHENEL
ncbi:MAG: TolC family protein [Candidatus Hydrogenedentes bacterium]|nr:TolC family protein [Candidatus Hydrogenedentota bacterium]